ncbi:MAG: pyridoxine 5'-phosphate synthase [Bacteroidales bacterium]|nr:pyridoxine 5'-phosphate synthase [Bacteroidales bacterium]
MIHLSVNINKIATIRNARGGNVPDVAKAAVDCEKFGANGITVHPRPDERHIKYNDVREIKKLINVELNIEGFPSKKFLELIEEVKPSQVTLVPDPPDAITSNAGWNVKDNFEFLKNCINFLHSLGIRTSIFVETDIENLKWAAETGTDRIEFYTEPYAKLYPINRDKAIEPYIKAAETAIKLGLGINAGHDLNLQNLKFLALNLPGLLEVSIGHALISDALYFGLEKTIKLYLEQLRA